MMQAAIKSAIQRDESEPVLLERLTGACWPDHERAGGAQRAVDGADESIASRA